jgi:hypothetical protein
MMGDTGPCVREILRPRAGDRGRPAGSPDEDGDRYIEI